MKAIINNQLTSVQVLKEKKTLFGDKVLVSYTTNVREDGKFMYEKNSVKWINKNKLIKPQE